jgi:large subunit ribosomal protein L11
MAKKIKAKVKLELDAGKATPSPPVGQALGQHGVNLMGFCKEFNAKTDKQPGMRIPVIITIYEDKTFSLELKTPPAAFLILKELGLSKGSGEPNKIKVGKISEEQLEKIANIKMKDLNAFDIEHAKNIIAGTARSMGIERESQLS